MLGSCFFDFFKNNKEYEFFAYDHDELDVKDKTLLCDAFTKSKPDILINCVAYTNVDLAESERDLAFKINAEAAGEMARLCKEFGAILIHFSTDYVFSGEKSEGYKEDDEPKAINVYGESKLEGEKLIMANMEKYYIVRTSWLFGGQGHAWRRASHNFVDTMIRLGEQAIKDGTELKIVDDQIGSPTYTNDLCGAVIKYFLEPARNSKKQLSFGIYHLTNSGTCSWYTFAKKIFEIKNMNVLVKAVNSAQFLRPAKRPKCSILINNKIPSIRSWEEALRIYLITVVEEKL